MKTRDQLDTIDALVNEIRKALQEGDNYRIKFEGGEREVPTEDGMRSESTGLERIVIEFSPPLSPMPGEPWWCDKPVILNPSAAKVPDCSEADSPTTTAISESECRRLNAITGDKRTLLELAQSGNVGNGHLMSLNGFPVCRQLSPFPGDRLVRGDEVVFFDGLNWHEFDGRSEVEKLQEENDRLRKQLANYEGGD